MSGVPFLTARSLEAPGVAHAFFTRAGGVSNGVYATLNGGVGSRDAPEAVTANRARMAEALGVTADRLAVPYQIHSSEALVLAGPWDGASDPAATALRPRRLASRSASPGPIAA